MSYILDALQKSDEERKLGEVPDLASSPNAVMVGSPSQSRNILIAISLLILLVVLLGLYMIMQNGASEKVPATLVDAPIKQQVLQTQVQQAQSPHSRTVDVPAAAKKIDASSHLSPDTIEGQAVDSVGADAIRPEYTAAGEEVIRPNSERRKLLQEEIQAKQDKKERLEQEYQQYFTDEKQTLAKSNDSETSGIDSADIDSGGVSPQAESDALQPAPVREIVKVKPVDQYADVGSIFDLNDSIKSKLPAIKISTHIYSSAPSYCSVTINGQRYKNGASIGPQLTLEKITAEGVVLSFQGEVFKMTSLQEWLVK